MSNGGELYLTDSDYLIPYSSQLNSTAERTNYTLRNKMRALLDDANFPGKMWGTAACLQNRSPMIIVATPAEEWYKKTPNLSCLISMDQWYTQKI